MEKISVTSSNIDSIGFDPENEILEITFLNGSTYQYDGVPENEYLNLMGATSHGSYLNKEIIPNYKGTKI